MVVTCEQRLDGGFVRVVDLYTPVKRLAKIPLVSRLVDGSHTVRIEVLGTRRRARFGNSVAVDRWLVV